MSYFSEGPEGTDTEYCEPHDEVKSDCARCWRERALKSESITAKLIEERDEALAKWHAHQKNVPCAGCVGGHDTFWKTVTDSAQWQAWEKSGPSFDVDECRECGHISQAHFQAFLAHHDAEILKEAKP